MLPGASVAQKVPARSGAHLTSSWLARLVEGLSRRFAGSSCILCYHGIADSWAGTSPAHVAVTELLEATELCREFGEIVPLQDLVSRPSLPRSDKPLFALTFDDAYHSLLDAVALLERRAIPLTIFATTGALARGAAYWWDRIERAGSGLGPEQWQAFLDAVGCRTTTPGVREGVPPGERLRDWILETWNGRWPTQLEPQLDALERSSGTATFQRSMTWDELASVSRLGNVEVGVHTVSHPSLPTLTPEEQAREIRASYEALSERSLPLRPFLAVPYGLYDETTLHAARSVGMQATLLLNNRTLRRNPGNGVFNRLSMTRGIPRWKQALRLAGVVERIRAATGTTTRRY